MPLRSAICKVILVLGLGSGAGLVAQELAPTISIAPKRTADPTGPEAYVDTRQSLMAAMQELGVRIDLEAQTADEATFVRLVEDAEVIAALMRSVPLLFPEGTGPHQLPGVTTHASPAIWEERDRFEVISANALAAAETLMLAPDRAALFARFEELETICTACHTEFLEYDPFEGMAGAGPLDEALFEFGGSAD
ncbi:cytochrome c [Rubellimicrobium rubrum]|uniref:Cytochrome c n=1 Tax=Rubellimicrobium rubrum TaxID=2585369 RepID=A0A5C4MH52_9RHOB|nr:cytochrome c [Rubellimicrobium rubrum]TNC43656.1 cytochrome c [Rubellimicrobium rubrum]